MNGLIWNAIQTVSRVITRLPWGKGNVERHPTYEKISQSFRLLVVTEFARRSLSYHIWTVLTKVFERAILILMMSNKYISRDNGHVIYPAKRVCMAFTKASKRSQKIKTVENHIFSAQSSLYVLVNLLKKKEGTFGQACKLITLGRSKKCHCVLHL
jgi:hypothetical protein